MRGCAGRELLEQFLGGSIERGRKRGRGGDTSRCCAACQALLDQLTSRSRGSAAFGLARRGRRRGTRAAARVPRTTAPLVAGSSAAAGSAAPLVAQRDRIAEAEDDIGREAETRRRSRRPPRRCPATRSSVSSAGAAWAWSTGRGRSA